MDDKAVRPNFFRDLSTFKKAEGEQEERLTDEEEALHALSQQKGWRIFKEEAQSLLKELDSGTANAMAQGLPFEEIGRNAVVIDLAKSVVQRLLNLVEDARDVTNEG